MKSPTSLPGQLLRLAAALTCAAAFSAPAATPPAPASVPPAVRQASLELPRLKTYRTAGDLPRLARALVVVDELAPQPAAGARAASRQNFSYLALEPGRAWTRPLRGGLRDTAFVSFLVYASVGTVIDAGGARLTVRPGTRAGYAQVTFDLPAAGGAAPPIAGQVRLERHDGADLVALPVYTLRLDPAAGSWDLFSFQRLVAEDLPLPATAGARQFSIVPGAQGAWVLNLTQADENPLCLDANANGIDDAFERARRNGALLAANAPAAERRALAAEWRLSQQAARVPSWSIRRPTPAAAPATPPR